MGRGGFGPFWRKWLIINERNFEKLNAMDRQCPLPYERMKKVECRMQN
jgi:hypothetical protein